MNMIRTIIWYVYFWMFMIFSIILSIPLLALYLPGLRKLRDRYICAIAATWARSLIAIAGGKVTVRGREKIPQGQNLCFIANHQGSFDIPITLAYLPGPIGFIAKKELMKMPIINLWMQALGCIFIDRKDRRAAVNVMRRGVESIQRGHRLILFPEGTRSRGPEVNTFKHGSLKLPIRSHAIIIPISISGSYKLLEKNGRISPGHIRLTIHDPIPASNYRDDETRKLAHDLEKVIKSAV